MSRKSRNSAVQTQVEAEQVDAEQVGPLPEELQQLIGDGAVEISESESEQPAADSEMGMKEVIENPAPAQATTEGLMAGDVNPIVRDGWGLDGLRKEHGTKSGVIRFLAALGYKRGDIARFLDIRYQHVRNVLMQTPKRVVAPTVQAQVPTADSDPALATE